MVIKILIELREEWMNTVRTSKKIIKYKKEPIRGEKHITEMKNTLEGINGRLDNTEEQTNGLEDRVVEITQSEQQKENRILWNEDSLRELWATSGILTFALQGPPEGKERKGQKTSLKK